MSWPSVPTLPVRPGGGSPGGCVCYSGNGMNIGNRLLYDPVGGRVDHIGYIISDDLHAVLDENFRHSSVEKKVRGDQFPDPLDLPASIRSTPRGSLRARRLRYRAAKRGTGTHPPLRHRQGSLERYFSSRRPGYVQFRKAMNCRPMLISPMLRAGHIWQLCLGARLPQSAADATRAPLRPGPPARSTRLLYATISGDDDSSPSHAPNAEKAPARSSL